MNDEEVENLVRSQLAEKADGDESSRKDATYWADDALAKDQEYKQIEAELSHRIVSRLELGPHADAYAYAGTFMHPLPYDMQSKIAAIHAYHDMIIGYEL